MDLCRALLGYLLHAFGLNAGATNFFYPSALMLMVDHDRFQILKSQTYYDNHLFYIVYFANTTIPT
jgi:hypothetical protein